MCLYCRVVGFFGFAACTHHGEVFPSLYHLVLGEQQQQCTFTQVLGFYMCSDEQRQLMR